MKLHYIALLHIYVLLTHERGNLVREGFNTNICESLSLSLSNQSQWFDCTPCVGCGAKKKQKVKKVWCYFKGWSVSRVSLTIVIFHLERLSLSSYLPFFLPKQISHTTNKQTAIFIATIKICLSHFLSILMLFRRKTCLGGEFVWTSTIRVDMSSSLRQVGVV